MGLNYTPPDWHDWFLQGVYWVASKSKDPKTKIGAILVKDRRIISTGYNGIPIGVDDKIDVRNQRPEKYKWFEHAERNSIYSAAKQIDARWSNQGPTVVHEMPWHKAHPGLKNTK